MRDGAIVREQGYGRANLEHDVPVTPDTVFQSGSTGKQFTAAGILLLVEDGRLGLDDSLANGTNYPYGFGWSLSEQRGEAVIEHGGSWQGFRAAITRYPEQRLAVVVLANSAVAQVEAMSHEIAGLLEPRLSLRSPTEPQTHSDPDLAKRLRDVLEAWSSSREIPAMSKALAETASGSAREADDRQRTAERLQTARSFHVLGIDRLSRQAIALLDDESVRAVDALLETDLGLFAYRFRLDAQGRVVSFSVKES